MKDCIVLFCLMFAAFFSRADILPGMEAYGDLTLVDEVECATDVEHEFHVHSNGVTQVETILGSACRTMAHPNGESGFFSYRIGKGKGLVAHDMYLLVVMKMSSPTTRQTPTLTPNPRASM